VKVAETTIGASNQLRSGFDQLEDRYQDEGHTNASARATAGCGATLAGRADPSEDFLRLVGHVRCRPEAPRPMQRRCFVGEVRTSRAALKVAGQLEAFIRARFAIQVGGDQLAGAPALKASHLA
jgi:hypothetical protein